MNDTDRWAAGEGPEPPRIRALLDAARDVPPMTAEEAAHLEHVVRVKMAAEDAATARRQRLRRGVWIGVGVTLAAGAAVAATALFEPSRGGAADISRAILSGVTMGLPLPFPSAAPKTTVPRLTSLTGGRR